ncbi:MAG: hypothetical protein RLZZ427_272 [Pseudomonadota bacterium]
METYPLKCHPDTPAKLVSAITASVIGWRDGWLELRWRIDGAGGLVLPAFAGKGRADGLWQATCFEAFLHPAGEAGYVELNLSPSERWAAYDFSSYRSGMADRPVPRDPVCTMRRGQGGLAIFDAAIPLGALPALPAQLSLTAVIEEQGGVKSYWALAHAPGQPDFHHAACFAAMLAAPSAP